MKNKFQILFIIIFALLFIIIIAIKDNPHFQLVRYLTSLVVKSIELDVLGKAHVVYKYDKTPCDGKYFSIDEEMILLENKGSAMQKTFYAITRYSLDNYKQYRVQEHISLSHDGKSMKFLFPKSDMHKEIKLYDVNSSFKILGYYNHVDKRPISNKSMAAYLIKTKDNHLAWIPSFEFNSNLCKPTANYFDSRKYHKIMDANYSKEKVELSKPTKAFSPNDETYTISKKYYKKLAKIRNTKTQELKQKESQRVQKKRLEKILRMHSENINNDIKKGNLIQVNLVYADEVKSIDEEAINILKSIDKNSINYIAAKRILYQINYLKNHPNAKILGANSKINPITNKVSISIISVDKDTWSDLMKAITNHNRKKIDEILSNNPNLNHSTNNNSKALYFAARENDTQTLKKLINLGMDINHQNSFGYTPLHAAIISNAYESAEILIKSGANLDIFSHPKNSYRETALKFEAKKKNVNYKLIDNLIAHGANIDARYKNEPTTLMYASRFCNKELVDYLLSKRANAKLKNQFGKNSTQIWNENCAK